MNEVNGNVSAEMASLYQTYIQQHSIPAWCGEHVNGMHSTRTTNIHTHGLHVRPGLNSNGTQSDNVLLRVIPQGDFREREKPNSNCVLLYPDELAGEAHYEWRLGDIPGLANEIHMPGTFWYHPHAHGATQNQVASGMAGFFLVEGDVDDAINRVMLGDALAEAQVTQSIPGLTTPQLDLTKPRGNYDYRERMILIARTNVPSNDPNAGPHLGHEQGPNVTLINGSYFTESMWMNVGAVERWRILNASPDAKGFLSFMVLNGFAYVDTTAQALMLQQGTDAPITMTEANLDDYKLPLYLLSYDGVTLVEGNPTDGYHYTIERLADVNAGISILLLPKTLRLPTASLTPTVSTARLTAPTKYLCRLQIAPMCFSRHRRSTRNLRSLILQATAAGRLSLSSRAIRYSTPMTTNTTSSANRVVVRNRPLLPRSKLSLRLLPRNPRPSRH